MPTPASTLKFIFGINDLELAQTPQVKGHGPQQDDTHFRPTGYKSGGSSPPASDPRIH